MSAEIINLKQVRKQRARDEKEAKAAENRARFGRSKIEREQQDQAQAQAGRTLDGHKLETSTTIDDAKKIEVDPDQSQ